MFEDDIFDEWLDTKSKEIITKLDKKPLSSEEMMVLVLKAQSNHFQHLDEDLRKEMQQLDEDLRKEMQRLREDMGRRFEQVDRRFEQVDRRFEQVDRRFDRMYSFMRWQTGLGFAALAGIYLKLFLG